MAYNTFLEPAVFASSSSNGPGVGEMPKSHGVSPGMNPANDLLKPTGITNHPARSLSGQRGITLAEILIVVVLLGIAAMIATANLQTIMRRFELESGVREFTAFLQDAPSRAKEISAPVFLVRDADSRQFFIARDAAATDVLDSLEIPQELTIAGPAAPVLRCDLYGRTFIGTDSAMMTALQFVSMTHANTPESSAPTYLFTVSPLWTVDVSR